MNHLHVEVDDLVVEPVESPEGVYVPPPDGYVEPLDQHPPGGGGGGVLDHGLHLGGHLGKRVLVVRHWVKEKEGRLWKFRWEIY